LLKIIIGVSRLGAFLAALIVAANTSHAGTKKKSGDDFQLTLSNKVYSQDPQSKFVRQTCKPDKNKVDKVKVSHSRKKSKPSVQ